MQYTWNPVTSYFAGTFGGRRALALTGWHFLRSCLGAHRRYKRIDWSRVTRVIFVCKGNICRSAYAGKRFQAFGIGVASAGLEADSGKPADPRAVAVARRFGIDLSGHRSTHISELELGGSDLLVAFEPEQADRLHRLPASRSGAQITLLGLWSPLPGMAYIHDPYGLPESYFEVCFSRIERGLEGLRSQVSLARVAREKMT